MRPDSGQISALTAMIARDLEAIARLDSELTLLSPALKAETAEYRDLAAAAYSLHNIYNALENVFEQISRTYENHVTDPVQWHRELLTKMFLEIPKIRPSVLPVTLQRFLNDLRGFRHVFRHSYDFELDGIKLAALARDWASNREALIAAVTAFRENLLSQI